MARNLQGSSVSLLALVLAMSASAGALAQSATDSASGLGEIVVTGSRIQISGYSQPTPVTVVGEAELQRDAKVSIGDSIRELPAVGVSASASNGVGANNIVGGLTGLDTVNLRQLGTNRTLVLLDGQRVVASNIDGVVDLGTIPSILVQRIDVVTGGASAAWGSDAVSGVVNLVLNRNFDGIRASVEGGQSYAWDHRSVRLQLAAGTGFADDRGRVMFAVNHMNSPDGVFANQRKWNKYRNLINNPAWTPTNDEPRRIHADNVGLAGLTNGGVIMGPNCLTPLVNGVCNNPNPLKYTQFVGPDATLKKYNPGIVTGAVSAFGDGETDYMGMNNLAVAYNTTNAFGYVSYELTDNLRLSAQANYGRSWAHNSSTPAARWGTLNIQRDNAFLPEEVRQEMVDLGLNAIQIGTTNINNVPGSAFSYDGFATNSVGTPVSTQKRELKRGVISLDGKIGSNWSWNAYYQHGEVRAEIRTLSNMINANYAFAVDAVRDSSGNIVCRAVLNGNPAAAGCVPLNVFGEGVASQEAIRYVNVKIGDNYEIIKLKQDVAAVSAQGTLPFGFAAGDIAMALGAEYRREEGHIDADPLANARGRSVANFTSFSGKYDVKEAFLEVEMPLLRDSVVNSLSLNAAGRVTDYSTSGRVETWKLGLTSEVNDLIRLRGTLSRDIRAPNLSELFSRGVATLGAATDPKTGLNVQALFTAIGNPDLKPEKADTISGGIVLSPAGGLNFSLDYYRIKLNGAIYNAGGDTVVNRCAAGEQDFCEQLDFNGPGGALSQIRSYPRNLSSQEVSGLDFQADWRTPLFAGELSSRLVGSYTLTQSQTALGVTIDYLGQIGQDAPVTGFPRLRGTLAETYTQGPASFTVQGRLVGSAKLNNAWGPKDVDDNSVPAVFYADLRGSYQLDDHAQMFFAVDNLLNRNPPNVASNGWAYFSTAVRAGIHDLLGRSYRLGMRVHF